MRRPQDPQDKQTPDNQQPPGGRAWQRVRDFERARGLPAESTPHADDEGGADKRPPTPQKKDKT